VADEGQSCGSFACASRSSTQNVLPFPSTDSKPMRPCISSVRRLAIASPRPAPWIVPASAPRRENGSNNSPCFSPGMPAPVSETPMRRYPPSAGEADHAGRGAGSASVRPASIAIDLAAVIVDVAPQLLALFGSHFVGPRTLHGTHAAGRRHQPLFGGAGTRGAPVRRRSLLGDGRPRARQCGQYAGDSQYRLHSFSSVPGFRSQARAAFRTSMPIVDGSKSGAAPDL